MATIAVIQKQPLNVTSSARAASSFENAIRYSFELLSRRFNAAHLFNTEEETGGNCTHASVCDGRHKAARDRMDTKAVLPRAAIHAGNCPCPLSDWLF